MNSAWTIEAEMSLGAEAAAEVVDAALDEHRAVIYDSDTVYLVIALSLTEGTAPGCYVTVFYPRPRKVVVIRCADAGSAEEMASVVTTKLQQKFMN